MEPTDLLKARIGELNGNIRWMLVMLCAWAIAFWWLSLSFMLSIVVAERALPDDEQLSVVPIVMSIVGFTTAYITAITLLGVDGAARDILGLSKALAGQIDGLTPGTSERGLMLKPVWPMRAVLWSFGLHAALAVLVSLGWLVVAFAMIR